ncbi:MAG TPA: thioredoxin family protein [Ktedonobacteraceae bacterium]|nr:thioredoxin family protein [Ktedonobacteraceae bacterium]
MPDIIIRIGVLLLVSLLVALGVWSGRRFVEAQRRKVLAASPLDSRETFANEETSSATSPVRILAFSSKDCKQCHLLQAPALQRVLQQHGDTVAVVEIDAVASPELTQQYHILTVPSTVILDARGQAHAVNYGFANTQRLLQQVDAVLGQVNAVLTQA